MSLCRNLYASAAAATAATLLHSDIDCANCESFCEAGNVLHTLYSYVQSAPTFLPHNSSGSREQGAKETFQHTKVSNYVRYNVDRDFQVVR